MSRITEIEVNEAGKIINITLDDKFSPYSKLKFIDDVASGIVNLENTSVDLDGTIITNLKTFGRIYFKLYLSDISPEDIKLTKVVYEECNNEWRILEIEIRVKNVNVAHALKHLGAKVNPNSRSLFKLNDLLIKHLILKNYKFRNAFETQNIRLNSKANLFYTWVYNLKDIEFIKDNTRLENLSTWMNKVKLMGKSDKYTIYNDCNLTGYSCTYERAVLPPVTRIGINCFTADAKYKTKEIVIPDTVQYIDRNDLYKLEKIQLGEKTLAIDNDLLSSSRIKEFDTKNLCCDIRFGAGIEELTFRLTMANVHLTGVNGINKVIIKEGSLM